MSPAALAAGIACAAAVVGSLIVLGVAGQRILLPTWRGTAAVTGGMAIALCASVALGQALGAVGLLKRWSVVSVLITAAAVVVAARRRPRFTRVPTEPDPVKGGAHPRGAGGAATTVLASFAVLVVVALWLARTVISLRRGIADPDSLAYHLPLTHVFASTGFADASRLPHAYLPVYTYPGNDELLSAMALVVTQSVVFSTVKNLAFAGAALVAAHAIGGRARAALPGLVSVAVVLGLPVAAFTVPGQAKNDALVVGAGLLGLGCLVLAQGKTAPLVLAAGCGGVVLGTKLSAVAFGGSLLVGALAPLHRRGCLHRWRKMGLALIASLVTGAPWYVRNVVRYGNPFPLAGLSIGPLRLRSIQSDVAERAASIATFLVRGEFYGRTFGHGLLGALGPVGLAVGLAGAIGIVAGFGSGGWRRGLAVLGVVLTLAYLATPATAYTDAEGRPIAFLVTINVHYALPAAAVGLLALAVSVPPRLTSWTVPVLGLAATLVGLPVGREMAYWFTDFGGTAFSVLVLAAAIGALAVGFKAAGGAVWRRMAGLAGVLALLGVASIARSPAAQRTEDPTARFLAAAPRSRIAASAGDLGTLYGPGGRHNVVILSHLVDRVPSPFKTCPSFMGAITARQPVLVAVTVTGQDADWVRADPAFRLEAAGPRVQLYSLSGVPGSRCPPIP